LSEEEKQRSKQHRGIHNILGYAYQIGALKMLGKFPENPHKAPLIVLSYLSEQLSLSSVLFLDYPHREKTKWEHAAEIKKLLGYKRFEEAQEKHLRNYLIEIAMHEESTLSLMQEAWKWFLKEKIIRPGISIIERIVSWAQKESDEMIFNNIFQQMKDDQKKRFDKLLIVPPGESFSPLQRLKKAPTYPSIKTFHHFMDIRDEVRVLLDPPFDFSDIPPSKISSLAKLTKKYHVWFLSRFSEPKRFALIACYLVQRHEELTDFTLDMFIRLTSRLFHNTEQIQKENKQKNFEKIRDLLSVFRHPIRTILDKNIKGDDLRKNIFTVVPEPELVTRLKEADELLQDFETHEEKPLDNRYGFLRKFFPKVLSSFIFHSQQKDDSLINMLNILKNLNETNHRKLPDELDFNFIPRYWQRLIKRMTGSKKRHFVELCMLDMLYKSLKSGDIWVEGSRRYADFKIYLIPKEEWIKNREKYYQQLQLPIDSEVFLNDLGQKIEDTLDKVNKRFPENEWAELKGKKLKLSRIDPVDLPLEVIKEKEELIPMMPSIKIQDILIEVDKVCPYTKHFVHLGGQKPSKDFKKNLFASLLAEGCNIGYKQMAEACPEIEYPQLIYVSHWYMHEISLRKAIAELVNFHHQLPIASVWGEGKKAMADGQRFHISKNTLRAEYNPRYFGYINRGGVVYSHFSDQHSQFYAQIINCSPREAIYVLDGLLNHDTILSIEEIFTDTHGYTEYIFALCNLLGIKFSPRIRDLPDQSLYKFDKEKDYNHIKELIDGTINIKLIIEQWDEIVRLVSSLKNRTVSPSLLLYRLNSYSRKNRLLKALREIGRIYKTIHILEYIDIPEKRQEIQSS
jgi:TnpA family transposase